MAKWNKDERQNCEKQQKHLWTYLKALCMSRDFLAVSCNFKRQNGNKLKIGLTASRCLTGSMQTGQTFDPEFKRSVRHWFGCGRSFSSEKFALKIYISNLKTAFIEVNTIIWMF